MMWLIYLEIVFVQVKKATSTVNLNCADITVSEAKYTAKGSDATLTAKVDYEKDDEKVVLTFPAPLQVWSIEQIRRVFEDNGTFDF